MLGLQIIRNGDIEHLGAIEPQALRAIAALELQWQHAHAHQVRAVNALVALGHHNLYAQQLRAFGGPVARRSGAVFLATNHDRGNARFLIGHCGVIDKHFFATGLEQGEPAFFAAAIGLWGQHQVFDSHIGKGAAHHHFMIAAS